MRTTNRIRTNHVRGSAAAETPADFPIITAHEAIAQGSTPGTLFSIASWHERSGGIEIARRARLVGREMAQILGVEIGGRHRRPANDNAHRRRRRAA